MPIASTKRELFSLHPSNPFDDPNALQHNLFGSSELTDPSSDLGGYGIPGEVTIMDVPKDVGGDLPEIGGEATGLAIGQDTEGILDGDVPAMDDDDEDMKSECSSFDEEELMEENSIMFRSQDERDEIMKEMEDLKNAVPKIAQEYELLDRLGTGEHCLFLCHFNTYLIPRISKAPSPPSTKPSTATTMITIIDHGEAITQQTRLRTIKQFSVIPLRNSLSPSREFMSQVCQTGFATKLPS